MTALHSAVGVCKSAYSIFANVGSALGVVFLNIILISDEMINQNQETKKLMNF